MEHPYMMFVKKFSKVCYIIKALKHGAHMYLGMCTFLNSNLK
jgi:hypothetical protein